GVGAALAGWAGDDPARWETLRRLDADSPLMQATLDNVEMALTKSDLRIAADYAALARPEVREAVLPRLVDEFDRTIGAVLRVTGRDRLLADAPQLAQVLGLRAPYLEPLHALQVALIERLRANPPEAEERILRAAALAATNGIAAGMRNTG
ncbi:MAG: phosphoenolpyruvate carboxylase, partial [Thermoleophilia bacterium]|nr:phosphoenolpyruvate carboxylase [Thermoleophilia bacterium]